MRQNQNSVNLQRKIHILFASSSLFTRRVAIRTLGKRSGIVERNFRRLHTTE
jgi:hypothetical protein